VYSRHPNPTGFLYAALFPESAGWNKTTQLLAAAVDIGHWFQWVRNGCDGDPPDRITRPGVVNPPQARKKGTPMRLSEAKKIYGQVGAAPITEDERARKLSAIFGHGAQEVAK
jgi:hypothetical protein